MLVRRFFRGFVFLGVPALLLAGPDAAHQQLIAKAKGESGAVFDKTYVEHAGVKDHSAARQLFERASKNAKDPDLKAFASQKLPIIEGHLQMAEQLNKSTGMN